MAELNLPAKSVPLAIEALITSRSHELGLNKARLVRLAGYKNEARESADWTLLLRAIWKQPTC